MKLPFESSLFHNSPTELRRDGTQIISICWSVLKHPKREVSQDPCCLALPYQNKPHPLCLIQEHSQRKDILVLTLTPTSAQGSLSSFLDGHCSWDLWINCITLPGSIALHFQRRSEDWVQLMTILQCLATCSFSGKELCPWQFPHNTAWNSLNSGHGFCAVIQTISQKLINKASMWRWPRV